MKAGKWILWLIWCVNRIVQPILQSLWNIFIILLPKNEIKSFWKQNGRFLVHATVGSKEDGPMFGRSTMVLLLFCLLSGHRQSSDLGPLKGWGGMSRASGRPEQLDSSPCVLESSQAQWRDSTQSGVIGPDVYSLVEKPRQGEQGTLCPLRVWITAGHDLSLWSEMLWAFSCFGGHWWAKITENKPSSRFAAI